MGKDHTEDETIYRVVVNHEEQYSLWPAHREPPPGWRDAGLTGGKTDCLAYIRATWTDMRPLSLRRKMEGSMREVEDDNDGEKAYGVHHR